MTTTLKHTGTERTWEGKLEQWQKHKECIEHWCDGGSIEVNTGSGFVQALLYSFNLHFTYRIKQREPKPGEVWVHAQDPNLVFVVTHQRNWTELGSGEYDLFHEHHALGYAAPSVKAYYARELLDDVHSWAGHTRDYNLYEKIKKAAQLEEE